MAGDCVGERINSPLLFQYVQFANWAQKQAKSKKKKVLAY